MRNLVQALGFLACARQLLTATEPIQDYLDEGQSNSRPLKDFLPGSRRAIVDAFRSSSKSPEQLSDKGGLATLKSLLCFFLLQDPAAAFNSVSNNPTVGVDNLLCRPALQFSAPSPEVNQIIKAQMGHVPQNILTVAASSSSPPHHPQVLLAYPLGGGSKRRREKAEGDCTPFPTIYWLSCPSLRKAISGIEQQGAVKEFESRLRSPLHSSLLSSMAASHKRYAADRWSMLTSEHRDMAEQRGWDVVLRDAGIAGIDWMSYPWQVKCLHTHYAHWLATRDVSDYPTNIVGQWTHELLLENGWDGKPDQI